MSPNRRSRRLPQPAGRTTPGRTKYEDRMSPHAGPLFRDDSRTGRICSWVASPRWLVKLLRYGSPLLSLVKRHLRDRMPVLERWEHADRVVSRVRRNGLGDGRRQRHPGLGHGLALALRRGEVLAL